MKCKRRNPDKKIILLENFPQIIQSPRNATSSLVMRRTAALLLPLSHFCPLQLFVPGRYLLVSLITEMAIPNGLPPRADCLGWVVVAQSCLGSGRSVENLKSVRFFCLTFCSSESPVYGEQRTLGSLASFTYRPSKRLHLFKSQPLPSAKIHFLSISSDFISIGMKCDTLQRLGEGMLSSKRSLLNSKLPVLFPCPVENPGSAQKDS